MNKIGCGECDEDFKCYNNTVRCIRLPIKDQEIYKIIANNYKRKASWGQTAMDTSNVITVTTAGFLVIKTVVYYHE